MCVPPRKEPQTCKYPRVTRTTYVNIYGKSFFPLGLAFCAGTRKEKMLQHSPCRSQALTSLLLQKSIIQHQCQNTFLIFLLENSTSGHQDMASSMAYLSNETFGKYDCKSLQKSTLSLMSSV